MSLPEAVQIVEVGPRDGLQAESQVIHLTSKLQLIEDLIAAGHTCIEAGSFVNPRWVPQMADSEQVFSGMGEHRGVRLVGLTPNLEGFERALAAGVDEVAVFTVASETFSHKNVNCSIEESLLRFEQLMVAAREHQVPVRGYVSCILGCPFEGEVSPQKVAEVTERMLDLGCYEISLADTIGVGTAGNMQQLLDIILKKFPAEQFAVHCHDTYGQALSNILVAVQHGIQTIDASVAGLGGCPFAPGASGNVATEDVVYMLHGMGIDTGIDLDKLIAAGNRISATLGRANSSAVARALKGS